MLVLAAAGTVFDAAGAVFATAGAVCAAAGAFFFQSVLERCPDSRFDACIV